MKFYSSNDKNHIVGLQEALMNGLAPDGGLYMPAHIPDLLKNFFKKESFHNIAFEVSKHFFAPEIPENTLKNIVQEAFDFDIPIIELDKQIYVLELFHGPTCAFKDFAARFMARLFGFFAEDISKRNYHLSGYIRRYWKCNSTWFFKGFWRKSNYPIP